MLKLWKFRGKLGTVEWPDDLPGPNFWIPQSSLIWDLPKELKEYVRRVTDSGKRFYQKVKRKQAPMIFGDKDRTMKAYHERSGETMGTRWTGRKEATEYARAVEKTLYVTVRRAWCRHCIKSHTLGEPALAPLHRAEVRYRKSTRSSGAGYTRSDKNRNTPKGGASNA